MQQGALQLNGLIVEGGGVNKQDYCNCKIDCHKHIIKTFSFAFSVHLLSQ